MSVTWTLAGQRHKENTRVRYSIRSISRVCPTCEGSGRVGEKVITWDCCPGFADDGGDWYSCPSEQAQELGPIAYRFEIEGGGDFAACPHCGPKYPEPVTMKEKIEARLQGSKACTDCSRNGQSLGKIVHFELVLLFPVGALTDQGADSIVLATDKSRSALQRACLSLYLTQNRLT